jgi:hypothetical protein
MATFVDLYSTLVDRELGSVDVQLFTTVRRKAAVNEAQREFVRLTDCLTRRAEIALSDGDSEKDLEAVVAADDFLRFYKEGVALKQVSGSTTRYLAGEDFPRRDIPWLDRHSSGWRSASAATPSAHYFREDGGQVFLGMTPPLDITGSDTWTLLVPYVAYPSDMSADADQPFTVSSNPKKTLREYHQALAHFAAARLETLRKNYQAYDRQMELFNSYVVDYTQKQRRPGGQHILFARDYLGEHTSSKIAGVTSDWWLR